MKYFDWKNCEKEINGKMINFSIREKLIVSACKEIIKNNIKEKAEKTGIKYIDGNDIYVGDKIEAKTDWGLFCWVGIIRGKVIKNDRNIFCIDGIIHDRDRVVPLYECSGHKKIEK
jgi:hypothetical protein